MPSSLTRIVALVLACLVVAGSPSTARAADRTEARPTSGAATVSRAGAAILLAGYAPVALAGLPSTVGFAGRMIYFFGTGGLGWLASCWAGEKSPDDRRSYDEYYRAATPDYLCGGDHGAAQLLVPVAGPILFVRNRPRDSLLNPRGSELGTTARTLLYASAGTQVLGALLALGGTVANAATRPATTTTSDDAPRASAPTAPRFRVAPMLSPTAIGIEAALVAF